MNVRASMKLFDKYFAWVKRLINRLSWAYSGDKYYGRVARKYQKRREKKKWWHQEQQVVKNLLDTFPDGISVLDAPFGTGRFVPFYLDKKMKIYGLDSSPEMFRAAKELLGADYEKCQNIVGDAADLPYADNHFDLIVCFRFLQSIVPFAVAKKVLKEFNRVTRSMAILELKVRHETSRDLPLPKDHVAMRDSLKKRDVALLLDNAGFHITGMIPVSHRRTHVLTAVLCEKKPV